MGIARNLEKRLERLADGLSAAVFRGKMHPVDLANRLVRQADLMVVDNATGPAIPNHFSVSVSTADIAADVDTRQLTAELSHTLETTAADRGWRTGGPIYVNITTDGSVGRGSIKCDATAIPAQRPAWGEIAEHRGDHTFALRDNRVSIGRSQDVDITLDNPEVSRLHAIIFREGGRLWLVDMGSANGTSINGQAVTNEPTEIGAGDMLTFGSTTFALRVH